jgi:hypothetical protein
MLTATGQTVKVFHSPETFVNSGAVFKSELLILGRTAQSILECGTLQWAAMVRPNLQTFLLHSDYREVHQLFKVCQQPELPLRSCSNAKCVDALQNALTSGDLPQTRGRMAKLDDMEQSRKVA